MARSMVAGGGWAAWPREDLAPRRAWMAERMRENVRRHFSHQCPTSEQAWRPAVCKNSLAGTPRGERAPGTAREPCFICACLVISDSIDGVL